MKIEEKDNLRHRIDLVRIEEGGEELEKLLEEKKIVVEVVFIKDLETDYYECMQCLILFIQILHEAI